MATISNLTLSVVRNVANADITATWTVIWSAFDQATNLPYRESFLLRGDDTAQDGDNLPVGDDPISIGLTPFVLVSSNGQLTTARSRTLTIPFGSLNEDNGFANPADNDDEIRAVVTYTPQLPVATSAESPVALVLSP